ncbi:MAG TPA: helix-turn-helix domain-containing protein [Pyrinomonadaceae bacterium]
MENRGAVYSRDKLFEIWGCDAMPSTGIVDVRIAWLRQKLEPNPKHAQFIQTIHDFGYKFKID